MPSILGFINRQFISLPPKPTASFKGKTVIITGGNAGLGLEAARWIVRLGGSKVILACRSLEKGKKAAASIRQTEFCPPETLDVWSLDMSSYASVLAFADRAGAELPRLDAVIGNAGVGGNVFRKTEDNEEMITTNVVSTALLGLLLHPKLRETASRYETQTHFTVTGSELYEMAKFKERSAASGQIFATLNDPSKANMGDRYNTSKLLVLFFIKQMANVAPLRSGSNVIVNCVAPGFCKSNLGAQDHSAVALRLAHKLIARETEVGARTIVYGASAGAETHGQYVPDCKISPTAGLTEGNAGTELQGRVWAELKEKLEVIRPGVTKVA